MQELAGLPGTSTVMDRPERSGLCIYRNLHRSPKFKREVMPQKSTFSPD
jgi:hypothetical protein